MLGVSVAREGLQALRFGCFFILALDRFKKSFLGADGVENCIRPNGFGMFDGNRREENQAVNVPGLCFNGGPCRRPGLGRV